MASSIRKASKKKQKARLLFYGLSGAGKTRNALEVAKLLTSEKIVVIDTENETSSLCCDLIDFDILPIDSPFSLDNLVTAFKDAEKYVGESGVIIIDTLSKFWSGVGGALDEVNFITGGNKAKTQDAWGKVTPKISKATETLFSSKSAHVIVTCRVKSETIMEEYTDWQGKTKTKAVKVGLAPVFKDGLEYEVDASLEFSLLTTKTGKDVQLIRNTKPPRIPYFAEFEAIIPPNTMEGMNTWNADEAVSHIKFFLEKGVDPALLKLIDMFNGKLTEYKQLASIDHEYSTLDLSTFTEEQLREHGRKLVADINTLKNKELVPM
ncbi:AAA family ATPase [Scytonema sp. NUACC26]|uniref:AAA family ATPase n=1 Tax=Scytonema sp. NUACC26 TaxID=3140176 RepID=UPI0034DBDC46